MQKPGHVVSGDMWRGEVNSFHLVKLKSSFFFFLNPRIIFTFEHTLFKHSYIVNYLWLSYSGITAFGWNRNVRY